MKESMMYLGNIPKYEDYLNSDLALEEKEKSEMETKERKKGNIHHLVSLVIFVVCTVGITLLLNGARIRGEEGQDGWMPFILYGVSVMMVGLIAMISLLNLMATLNVETRKTRLNKDLDELFKGNIKLLNGDRVKSEYSNLYKGFQHSEEDSKLYDGLQYSKYEGILNGIVSVQTEKGESITRLYNILGTYDNGRIMNTTDFYDVKDSELEKYCKEKELSEEELVGVYKLLATNHYLETNKGKTLKEKSNFQKEKDDKELKYKKGKGQFKGLINE